MLRFKVLIGLVLFALSFSVLPIFNSETEKVISNAKPKPNNDFVDHKEIQIYKQQQNALKEALTLYFNEAIASGDIVGAGVSIVRRDSIVISDGFGKKNIKFNDKIDGETVFRLGSLSKGFAGILAASLNAEGTLHWNDKVSDYLPDFRLGNKPVTDKITLANILSHTSGTPYHSYTNLVEAGLPLGTIAKQFKNVNPISKPGLMYSYQNAMFALSGEIMRKATGQDITELLNDRFFKPLGMTNTSMDGETLVQTENIAMPHSKNRHGFKALKLNDNYYNAVAAGGINASAVDMAKWMRFLLGHNPDIMDKSAFEAAFNPFIEIKGHSKYYQKWSGHLASYYGFGWRIHKYLEDGSDEEKTILHHGGSVNNYRNEIALFPEDDLGICVLLNSNSKIAQTVIPDLQKIVSDIYSSNTSKMVANSTDKKTTSVL